MSYTPVQYKAKDYGRLKGLHAISDDQIAEHLKLYNGYVTRTNALLQRLADMANEGKHGDPGYQEMKRRFGWEFDGMRLHELYFDNLAPNGKGKLIPDSAFGSTVTKAYGSIEVEDKLKDVTQPVLVCTGRLDRVCTVPAAEAMAKGLPDAELVIFEKSGHMTFVDQPRLFLEAVQSFLSARN